MSFIVAGRETADHERKRKDAPITAHQWGTKTTIKKPDMAKRLKRANACFVPSWSAK